MPSSSLLRLLSRHSRLRRPNRFLADGSCGFASAQNDGLFGGIAGESFQRAGDHDRFLPMSVVVRWLGLVRPLRRRPSMRQHGTAPIARLTGRGEPCDYGFRIPDQYRRFGTIRPRWHVRWHPTYRTRWRMVRWAVRACGWTGPPERPTGRHGGLCPFLSSILRVFSAGRMYTGCTLDASTGYLDFLADHHGVIRHHVLRIFRGLVDVGFPCVCGRR